MALADVIYRLVTDESFRLRLKADSEEALAAAGLHLGEEELGVLNSVNWDIPAFPIGPCYPGWWAYQLDHCPIQQKLFATG
jgi:hypothetical protein